MDAQQYLDGNGSGASPNLADRDTVSSTTPTAAKPRRSAFQDQNGRSTTTDYNYNADSRLTYNHPGGLHRLALGIAERSEPGGGGAHVRSGGGSGRSVTDAMGYATLYPVL